MANLASKHLDKRFPGQKPGEQIQHLVRKHWIIDIKIGLFGFTFGLLPLIAYIVGLFFFWPGEIEQMHMIILLGFLVYMQTILLVTYVKWLNEELDLIIVTNERVIAHDQIDLFHRSISETSIAQIQDVKGVEKGLFGHLFHYGMMEIQTAARDIIFTIKNVGQPYKSARVILDVRDHYLDKEKFEKAPGQNSHPHSSSPVYNL